MIRDDQLDAFRVEGIQVRVIRDAMEINDVIGHVVAWDEEQVMIRKRNRRIVRLNRSYLFQPSSEARRNPLDQESEG